MRGLFSQGLTIGGNFAFQNGFGLTMKTAENTKITAQTSYPNSSCMLWAYVRKGLLSEGYFAFEIWLGGGGGGLIFGRACFRRCLLLEF